MPSPLVGHLPRIYPFCGTDVRQRKLLCFHCIAHPLQNSKGEPSKSSGLNAFRTLSKKTGRRSGFKSVFCCQRFYEPLGKCVCLPQVGTTRSVDAIKRERSIALPQDANAMEVADLLRQHIFAAVLSNDAASCCQKLR